MDYHAFRVGPLGIRNWRPKHRPAYYGRTIQGDPVGTIWRELAGVVCMSADFFKHCQRLLSHLKNYSITPSLRNTKTLHALTVTLLTNPHQSIFLYNNVLSFYVSHAELFSARKLFDEMSLRNVVSFNTMINAYSRLDYGDEAWRLFLDMRNSSFRPTQHTVSGLLSCSVLTLFEGIQLQALALKNGLFFTDAFVGTALSGFYAKHGCLDASIGVFEDMPRKNLVTFNSMMYIFALNGFIEDSVVLLRKLLMMENQMSESSFVAVLSGFVSKQDLEIGAQIHGLVIKSGFVFNILVANALINMYVRCSGVCAALKKFEEMTRKDTVSFNTILGALVKCEMPETADKLFFRMMFYSVLPNKITFAHIINCCADLPSFKFGQSIHAEVIKKGLERDVIVGSALVDFYAKCDYMEDAHYCFNEIVDKNVVCWNALISGYTNKCPSTAILLLIDMLRLGYRPNEFTFSNIIKSSLTLELWQLHGLVVRMGYQNHEYVLCSLMSSYAENGFITDAMAFATIFNPSTSVAFSNILGGIYNKFGDYHRTLELLSLLEEPDAVSWNVAIAACAHKGDYKQVFDIFRLMLTADVLPDNYTMVSLLSSSSKLCNLALGSSLHSLIIKTNISRHDTFLCNALIDMYGKCGSVGNSVKIFDRVGDRNLITWTALISALGLNGFTQDAVKMFKEMGLHGFKPDRVAFSAVLAACRHGGLVKEGMELFGQMKTSYGIEPDMDNYNCVVDLLARKGHLKEAEYIIAAMPVPPSALVWRSFVEGSRVQSTDNC